MPFGVSLATDCSNDRASVEIAELSRHDWTLLRRLRLDALRDAPEAFITTWNDEKAHLTAYWQDQFDQKYWVVARDFYDVPVGVAALNFFDGNPENRWFVESVWVAPAHRRTGVLRHLIESLDKYALNAGAPALHLWVLETNKGAEAAYTRLGYTRDVKYDQPTKKARPDGTFVNECLMVKLLP